MAPRGEVELLGDRPRTSIRHLVRIVTLAALLITNAVLNLVWELALARTQTRWSIRTSMIIGTGCFIAALVLFRLGLETLPLLYLVGIVFWSAGQAALLPGQEIMLHQLTGNANGLTFGLGCLVWVSPRSVEASARTRPPVCEGVPCCDHAPSHPG